ncbi:MAG: acyl-CoA thioesterase [Gammaproteobacteria bacterium]|nr:acyl-CoA thioesterase [Gammaproteobacteria bacterium]
MYREQPPEDREATIRTMAMPADTNGLGDIFGGWLMSHADIAGAVLAFRRASGRVVTIAVNEFAFLRPVFVGDVVSFYTDINKVGNSSITVDITMFSARTTDGREEHVRVATAQITYVHIGADRQPRAVPKKG